MYGTHYAIRFTHKQMVPTPVLLPDAPGDGAHAELRANNPFAWGSTVTSTHPCQQKGKLCTAEAGSSLAAGNLLRDQRRARKVVVEERLSSSTEPVEAAAKGESVATPSAQVGEDDRHSAPTRQHSV